MSLERRRTSQERALEDVRSGGRDTEVCPSNERGLTETPYQSELRSGFEGSKLSPNKKYSVDT